MATAVESKVISRSPRWRKCSTAQDRSLIEGFFPKAIILSTFLGEAVEALR